MATAKSATTQAANNGQQTIEQLQQRYEQLRTRKIQAQTKLESARDELERLKKEAREKYGTDDIAELRQRLETMKQENERKRAEYQADLSALKASWLRSSKSSRRLKRLPAKEQHERGLSTADVERAAAVHRATPPRRSLARPTRSSRAALDSNGARIR